MKTKLADQAKSVYPDSTVKLGSLFTHKVCPDSVLSPIAQELAIEALQNRNFTVNRVHSMLCKFFPETYSIEDVAKFLRGFRRR